MRRLLLHILLPICILMLSFTAYGTEATTPSGIPLSEMGYRIDEVVAEFLHQTAPGVAVVVFSNGEIIFSKGYGYADVENRIPMDPATTIIEFGSVGKVSIWMAVMQLVEQGLLDLDVDINMYLPEDFRCKIAIEMPFTLRDLMNHAAGFGGYIFDVQLPHRPRYLRTLDEMLLMVRPCQIFEPGSIGTYSNFGVALAALIVENITGQRFAIYERENILYPAGMHNTLNLPDWIDNYEFLQNKANGYVMGRNGEFHRSTWTYFQLYPAGGLNGTPEDFARLGMALIPPHGEPGPLFKNPDTLSTIFTPSSLNHDERPGTHHGLWRWDGVSPAYGHIGLTIAFTTYFAVSPYQRFGFSVHTNASFGPGLPFVVAISELLLGSNALDVNTVQLPDNLPSAHSVAGPYVMANRHENFLLELIDYTSLARVTAIDDNTITMYMTFMGAPVNATYVQVAPYVFRLITGTPFMRFLYSELRFEMENGVPTKIIVANGFDLTALPPGREMPILIGSVAIAIVSLIFFIIMPVIILVWFLIKRKSYRPNHFYLASTGLLLCGTLFVINHLILLSRLSTNVWRTTAEIMPHVWANYVLLILICVVFIVSLIAIRGAKISKTRIALFATTVVLASMAIIVLYDWNFFTLR